MPASAPPAVGPELRVFVPAVLLVAIVTSYLRGGRLSRLADAPLYRPSLLFLGVGVQILVDLLTGRGLLTDAGTLGWIGLLMSQLLVVAFLVANRHLPGVLVVGAGLLLNAVVMAANGAMPVDPAAIRALGGDAAALAPGKHTLLTGATRLRWLADIWAVPPLRSIVSIGDVVLAAGLLPLTHALMSHRPPAERRGRAQVPDAT